MNLTRRTEFTHPGMPAAPRSCLPGRTRDLGRSVWNDVLPRSRRSKAGQQYGEPVDMGIQTLGSVSVLIFGVSRMISLGSNTETGVQRQRSFHSGRTWLSRLSGDCASCVSVVFERFQYLNDSEA